ncbi:MAG: hypothetical protein K8F62_07150 [Pseudorhodoplanes sp.]|nr:hypothetical protein [Pseudorhodoplanes sp.]
MLAWSKDCALRGLARILLAIQPTAERLSAERILRQIGTTGDNITIRRNVIIQHPEKLVLGRNVMINHNTLINAGGGVEIGDDVVIGPGCMILTGNHFGSTFFGNLAYAPIKIGGNVWLAAQVVVTPGSNIGTNVLIGAGAVVTGNIPSNSIAVGSPARVVSALTLPYAPSSTLSDTHLNR